MEKSREALQKEHNEAVVRRKQYTHRRQRLKNRIRHYTESERKKRDHRLVTHGTKVECAAPEVCGISQSAFRILVEQSFSLPEVTTLVGRTVDRQESD